MKRKIPPIIRYLKKSHPLISGSLGLRGCLSMMSKSGGLNPSAVAGNPSVTRLTQSNWTGIKASGRPMIAVRKILKGKKRMRSTKRIRTFESNHQSEPLFLQGAAAE